MGGENVVLRHGRPVARGSSPRGRGKLDTPVGVAEVIRLIPAWAGKTIEFNTSPGSGGAHPRVGGENGGGRSVGMRVTGSSPRGRGKPRDVLPGLGRAGLIPAWAGKTRRRSRAIARLGAHPRVGGENVGDFFDLTAEDGSSPRGRGKLGDVTYVDGTAGLIPAWAGKTQGPRSLALT